MNPFISKLKAHASALSALALILVQVACLPERATRNSNQRDPGIPTVANFGGGGTGAGVGGTQAPSYYGKECSAQRNAHISSTINLISDCPYAALVTDDVPLYLEDWQFGFLTKLNSDTGSYDSVESYTAVMGNSLFAVYDIVEDGTTLRVFATNIKDFATKVYGTNTTSISFYEHGGTTYAMVTHATPDASINSGFIPVTETAGVVSLTNEAGATSAFFWENGGRLRIRIDNTLVDTTLPLAFPATP